MIKKSFKITRKMRGKVLTLKHEVIGYKKLRGGVAQIIIPVGAKIVVTKNYGVSIRYGRNLHNKKLRCDIAMVSMIVPWDYYAKYISFNSFQENWGSQHNHSFLYNVGKIVKPTNKFSPATDNFCKSGIHFFLSLKDAENY